MKEYFSIQAILRRHREHVEQADKLAREYTTASWIVWLWAVVALVGAIALAVAARW